MMTLLVLDFDGVICDSIEECFASSWEAWHRMAGGGPIPPVPSGRREAFARLRPFVRTGEDFAVMLWIAERGMEVDDQASFDAVASAVGAPRLAEFKERFYRARKRMLAEERDHWLSMNRVYPHAREALQIIAPSSGKKGGRVALRILSTKQAPYIVQILEANGVGVPAENVRYCPSGPKMPWVLEELVDRGCERGFFIDDQIDYLVGQKDRRIQGYLAQWGYVQRAWLEQSRVPVLDPAGFLDLARNLVLTP